MEKLYMKIVWLEEEQIKGGVCARARACVCVCICM